MITLTKPTLTLCRHGLAHPHGAPPTWLHEARYPLKQYDREPAEGAGVSLNVVEICAGAGGQALGLERAGFEHEIAVELDRQACATLQANRPAWKVAQGDVADPAVWRPRDFSGVSLLAGGVPCPPFTIAGMQLGASDERDLFAWAIELAGVMRPRALMLENVRGLSMPRFSGYRQHVVDRLTQFGYVSDWKLIQASDFGVPQLRPRFILVALDREDAPYFRWPDPQQSASTVGLSLEADMAAEGWEGAREWARHANKIAPTIVGGSKKHGGADLGPTRAKRAWAELGVNAMGVADAPPQPGDVYPVGPKLTTAMVAKIQGWNGDYPWTFTGRKTSRYRQIGNAFPPPVAHAVGAAIANALEHSSEAVDLTDVHHDPIYTALRTTDRPLNVHEILALVVEGTSERDVLSRIDLLRRDFNVTIDISGLSPTFKLNDFKAFTGQTDHSRHIAFQKHSSRFS